MRRIRVVFLLGLFAALTGGVVTIFAQDLASDWQNLAGGRIGFVSPTRETTYRMMGLIMVGFGLVLEVFALQRWLAVESRRGLAARRH
jgi:hypothetical protein